MSLRGEDTCRTKVGLLFLSDCDAPAKENCKSCNRPICNNHTVDTEKGVMCPECAAELKSPKVAKQPSVERLRRRENYHSNYGYIPYYYGSYHYFSDRDYNTFDDQEIIEYEANDDFDDNDFDDQDMES